MMHSKTILTFTMILLLAFVPAVAENENEERADQVHEIDNYDFLYADGYDEDFSFASVDSVLDEAFSHLGARYRSGMSGPSAFDCSGFTSYVFKNLGVDLNRTSRSQYLQGEAVKKKDLQSGDLVFFTSPGSGRRIGHVGIVVDVDPMTGSFNFIHASSRKGVVITNSKEGYYARRYVGARRIKL